MCKWFLSRNFLQSHFCLPVELLKPWLIFIFLSHRKWCFSTKVCYLQIYLGGLVSGEKVVKSWLLEMFLCWLYLPWGRAESYFIATLFCFALCYLQRGKKKSQLKAMQDLNVDIPRTSSQHVEAKGSGIENENISPLFETLKNYSSNRQYWSRWTILLTWYECFIYSNLFPGICILLSLLLSLIHFISHLGSYHSGSKMHDIKFSKYKSDHTDVATRAMCICSREKAISLKTDKLGHTQEWD